MMTKLVVERIDNGWIIRETGREVDGSTYKDTRSLDNEKDVMLACGHALDIDQMRLEEVAQK